MLPSTSAIQQLGLSNGSLGRVQNGLPNFSAGGVGGIGGGVGGRGGGGGDGDSGAGDNEDDGFKLQWKGWSERVAADPEFGFKVLTEMVIGVSATVLGDMATRPNWGLNELDFVFATLVVGLIMNFSLVYLLAPALSTNPRTYAQLNLLEKLLSEETLTRMGAPGGHIFQAGYKLGGRVTNLFYKGALFGLIGMGAGVVGTSVSNFLLDLRLKYDPNYKPSNPPPPVLANASVWATHMAVSSNLRYQMLNGIDMVVSAAVPANAFRLLTFAYRTGNNVLGGVSFVTLAKLMGVQSTDDKPAEKEEKPDPKAKKTANKKNK